MRTTETIYQEMLTAYAQRRGSQLEQDCDLAVRLWAAAAQIQALEAQAEWVLGQSFPQTATGVYLDRHAAMRNMTRQAAGKAVGSLTFTLANTQTGAVNIPAGTVCMTEDAVRFQTVEDAAIPAGEISVTAAAFGPEQRKRQIEAWKSRFRGSSEFPRSSTRFKRSFWISCRVIWLWNFSSAI